MIRLLLCICVLLLVGCPDPDTPDAGAIAAGLQAQTERADRALRNLDQCYTSAQASEGRYDRELAQVNRDLDVARDMADSMAGWSQVAADQQARAERAEAALLAWPGRCDAARTLIREWHPGGEVIACWCDGSPGPAVRGTGQ